MEKITTPQLPGQQGLAHAFGAGGESCSSHPHLSLSEQLESVLQEARPRLLRLASLNRIPAEAVEDVVQDTLFEAWRHLEQVRDPERFAAWLDGICRNVCRRQLRLFAKTPQQIPLAISAEEVETAQFDLPDPLAFDPVAELERQDLHALLDRALSHLSQSARELVELCYLAELPQREVAQRLQMSLGALELKLHRTRKHLKQILNGTLRAEAKAFGLLLTEEEVTNWQQTRLWCWRCGKHRYLGMFERMPWGGTRLRLRCPQCDKFYNGRERAGTILAARPHALDGLHSFRPALRRILQAERAESDWTVARMINEHRCSCQAPMHFRAVTCETPCEPPFEYRFLPPARTYLRLECPTCGVSLLDLNCVVFSHPAVRSFLLEHPRVLFGPDVLVSYAGQDAISWRLLDLSTHEHLTMFAHPHTLQVIATLQR